MKYKKYYCYSCERSFYLKGFKQHKLWHQLMGYDCMYRDLRGRYFTTFYAS